MFLRTFVNLCSFTYVKRVREIPSTIAQQCTKFLYNWLVLKAGWNHNSHTNHPLEFMCIMKTQKLKMLQLFINSIIGYRENIACNILVNGSICFYIGSPNNYKHLAVLASKPARQQLLCRIRSCWMCPRNQWKKDMFLISIHTIFIKILGSWCKEDMLMDVKEAPLWTFQKCVSFYINV